MIARSARARRGRPEGLVVPPDEPDEDARRHEEPPGVRNRKPGEDGEEDSGAKGSEPKVGETRISFIE